MRLSLLALFTLLSLLGARTAAAAEAERGPLAAYVAKEDASFVWKKRREGELGKGKYVELTLTSQTWHDVVWKHQLFIYHPSKITAKSQAVLMIEGGRWQAANEEPAKDGERLPSLAPVPAAAAESMHCPVAVLLQVPQQPIFDGMVEDQAIAYTFSQFIRTKETDWPLLLPMVKSAVRGMDAVQQFTKREWSLDIEHFTVTGASKRGWTTWLSAVVDPRVNAIAPMVIDTLNFEPQMKLQVESFGAPSDQLRDYTRRGLHEMLGTDIGKALREIVDPYSYRATIKQPKLIMLGTNDPYWPLDALNLYWDGLEGEKHILYVPNNGHGLRDIARVHGGLAAINRRAVSGKPLPKLAWRFGDATDKLTLSVTSDVPPQTMQIWTTTAKTRDFRQAKWTAVDAKQDGDKYLFELPAPESGFAAAFAEAKYEAGDDPAFYQSTNVRIIAAADVEKK